MMEINDLKSIWKKTDDQGNSGYWVSEDGVKEMIKKQSHAAVADIVRQMRHKIRLSAIIGLLTLAIGLAHLFFVPFEPDFFLSFNSKQYGVMMIFLALSILTISIQTRFRHDQINQLQRTAHSLKRHLEETKRIFQKMISMNLITDSIVLPIVATAGLVIKLYGSEPFAFDSRLLYLLLSGPVAFFGLYQFSKFKFGRKFGHFIRALDNRLLEIKSMESEIID